MDVVWRPALEKPPVCQVKHEYMYQCGYSTYLGPKSGLQVSAAPRKRWKDAILWLKFKAGYEVSVMYQT